MTGASASRSTCRAARDPRRLPRRGRRRRSRSACCTPTPTRVTSRRCSSGCASSGRRSRRSPRTRSRREWREYERTSTTVLSAYVQPVAERYLGRLADRRPRARLRRPALHHAVELRRRLGREDEGDPDHDGRVGPRERLLGRRRARAADRRAERARARHRRHDREVLADRGRPREDHLRLLDRAQPPLGRLPDPWCRSSTSSRSGTAAAASPGSTTSGSCTSGRSRPARCRARPPTAAAAPTATTTDANLALGRINRDYFCGGEIEADMAAVERALDDGRRARSASIGPRPPAASSGSRTTT